MSSGKLARFSGTSALFLALAMAFSGHALCQSGSLEVLVLDDDGPLRGATVKLGNERGYIRTTALLTDADGVALFPVLRAGGGYFIEISFPGYGTVRKMDLSIHLDTTMREPVLLKSEMVEEVIASAKPELVSLEKTETSSKFSDEFIQDLPVPGRYYQNVLSLAPGVQDSDGDGNPNVHGSRERDFKTVVSGISNVDPLTGKYMSNINPNSIEELEVITAGASVEFSRAQGGFARIIQKQGTNDFEGVVDYIYRSHFLDGDGAGNLSGDALPKFDWHQPGFQVTGPIVRDRLWFRASHEWILREDPVDVLSGIEVLATDAATHSDQITWQVSPRNKLALLFQRNPIRIENLGVSSVLPPESTSTSETDPVSHSLTWTAPVSPELLFETAVAYQDMTNDVLPTVPGQVNRCVPSDAQANDLLLQAQCIDLDTGLVSGAHPTIWKDHRQRFTLSTGATVYGGRFWGMNHQFKFGFLAENERYFREMVRNPIVWRSVAKAVIADTQTGQVGLNRIISYSGQFSVPQENRDRATGTNWGLYLEDQMKPRSNLAITLGARVDREIINSAGWSPFDPSEQLRSYLDQADHLSSVFERNQVFVNTFWTYEGMEEFLEALSLQVGSPIGSNLPMRGRMIYTRQPENINISNTNFSPFLGVSWDPWADGKTKLALSARRYYDKIFLAIPLIELGPATASVEMNVFQGRLVPYASVQPNVSVFAVDHELRTPYQDELALTLEREISTETALRLTWIQRRYRDQLQDVDLNHQPGDYGRCVTVSEIGQPAVVPITNPRDPLFGKYPYGGDGIIDDCVGTEYIRVWSTSPGGAPVPIQEGQIGPDGIPDLYLQNPLWGDIRVVGNHGSTEYEAFVVEVNRRQYRNWEFQGSYTWSRTVGDGEDYNQSVGDDRSLLEAERGPLSHDQRHVVKLIGTSITPWGFRLGTAVTWQSGLPYSVLERVTSYDPSAPILRTDTGSHQRQRILYPTGKRNDRRNHAWWNVDLKATKEFRVGNDGNMQLSLEVFNLLNDGTYMVYNFSPGFKTGSQYNGVNEATRRFGRRFQLGLRFMF